MAFNVSANDGGERFLIPEGQYSAVCFALCDLGTQHDQIYGTNKRKMAVCWELPELQIDYEENGRKLKRPATMIRTYTRSLHEKAALRADLEAWRCKAFTAEELQGFDISKLIGAGCLMQIVHNESGGKTYANISTLMKLPQGSSVSGGLDAHVFNIDEDGLDVLPEWLPDWAKEKIQASKEYQEHTSGAATNAVASGAVVAEPPSDNAADDLPF